jgi:hypothetical protein
MADRATTLIGSFQKVTIGTSTKVLGVGKFTINGATRKTVDASEFGVDIDIFEFGSADGGTITLSPVMYDMTDPSQLFLISCCQNATKLTNNFTSGLRFWLNSTSYMTIGTSGAILLTDVGDVNADRSGMATTQFVGKISGAFMMIY